MPGKVKVRVVKGRNLPVMDRAADTTDAYVEVKLGNVTHKTDVFRKSLNPEWNSEWFRFEVSTLKHFNAAHFTVINARNDYCYLDYK